MRGPSSYRAMGIIIKTPEQIEGIRKSCRLAASCLEFIRPFVKEGVTTEFLDDQIAEYIRDHGATSACLNYVIPTLPTPYPKSTCISLNEVICHGIPSPKIVLKPGDILNIDVTTVLDGYYGDTSTMFSVPPLSTEAKALLVIANKCLHLGINEVWPGNYFGNIGHRIWQYAMLQGVTVVYQLCGHGVGLNFHEEPQVAHIAEKNTGPVMEPGMIFTIEPMINLGRPEGKVDEDKWTIRTVDGKLSAQYEHTMLVLPHGHEILTQL